MYYIIFLIAIIGLAEPFFEYWYICIPSTAIIMYYYLIKEKRESKKKALNSTSICIVILTIILLINKYPRDKESKNDSGIHIYNTEDSKDNNFLTNENEESTETQQISSELQESFSDIEEYTNEYEEIESSSVENPFPHTEDYTVNNILIEYNKIAEYPIDEIIMNGMKNNTRPLGRVTITISNGVYFILLYNDYNKTIFVEYQEETDDNSGLYAVVRDMSKAIKPEMSNEEVETMIEEVKNGDKSGYFDNSLGVREFGFAVITREINKEKTQYLIRCKYTLYYN